MPHRAQAQALLFLVCRDGFNYRRAADTTGLSIRALAYEFSAARPARAAVLDSLEPSVPPASFSSIARNPVTIVRDLQ